MLVVVDEAAAVGGLNRTSVGLKLVALAHDRDDLFGLNRTSVGLKPLRRQTMMEHERCLNRTSVGLKPAAPRRP